MTGRWLLDLRVRGQHSAHAHHVLCHTRRRVVSDAGVWSTTTPLALGSAGPLPQCLRSREMGRVKGSRRLVSHDHPLLATQLFPLAAGA